MEWVFKHQNFQMFGLKLYKYVIFTHLKLRVAIASQVDEKLNYIGPNLTCLTGKG